MCSVAWSFFGSGYELVFNRDEQWCRPRSHPVRVEYDHPVPGLCARDAQAGGTWLYVNSAGLTLALMNAYPPSWYPKPGLHSRGEIPLLGARFYTLGDLTSYLDTRTWTEYAPFSLLCWEGDTMEWYRWDGLNLVLQPRPTRNFLTSSSVNPASVRQARENRYDQIREHSLIEILTDSQSSSPSEAIFVTRDDGGTVSQSMVRVTPERISLQVRQRDGASSMDQFILNT